VFVNGHHLGRFWNVGPQQTLYLPGCWLKKGKNSIIIFDQNNDIIQNKIITSTFPILDKLPNTEKQF
jgi:beta-galactosidase